MWKPALGVAAVIVVVAMSGCAASSESQPAKSSAPVETSAPVLTAAPDSPEAVLLRSVQAIEGMSSATLETTLPVADDICAQLADGAAPADLTPIENGSAMQNLGFVFVAADTMCNEYSQAASDAYTAEEQASRAPLGE